MRIERLGLVRYGRFTDCTLEFGAPGLHLVVGPNEAGKSTLRSSVGELLYGIHPQTKLGFLHAMQDLRIDALLRGADGGVLEVTRLKKNKDPLRTANDAPLKQGTLDQLLAGVDERTFGTVFALDHEELRDGGRSLLEGKGDLGEALFESRSSARLSRIQERLREQYKDLYTPHGRNQPLNALVGPTGRLAQAKRERDAALLDPRQYQQVTDAVAGARREYGELSAALHKEQVELTRMRRIRQAYAGVDERRELLANRMTLLAEGMPAPVHAQATYTEIDQNRRTLTEAARSAQGELVEIEAQLDGLEQQAESLGALAGDGPASGPEYVARLEALLLRVEELHEAKLRSDAQLDEARKTARKREQGLAKRAAALPEPDDELTDPIALRAGLKAVPEGLLARIESTRKQVDTAEAKLGKARKRYARFALPEQLGELAVPGEEELEAQLARIAEADAALSRTVQKHESELERGREQRRELDSFLAQDPPPSEEELQRTRARRQELWTRLRSRLVDGGGDEPLSPDLVPEYESAVSAGDDTADWMRREARRLAERRGLELAVRESADRVVELEEALGEVRGVREALDGEWAELWETSGLPAPTPDSAADLMRALAYLRELSEVAEQYGRELAADEASAQGHAERLRVLLIESGVPAQALADSLGLPELRAHADERQAYMAEAVRKRATAASKLSDLRVDAEEANREVAEIEVFAESLGKIWDELTRSNGLEGTSTEVKTAVARMLKVEEERSRLRLRQAGLLSSLEKTAEQQKQTAEALTRLLAECGADSQDALKAAIARGEQLRGIDSTLDSVEKSLTGHGSSVEQLEREVADHDVDELVARIDEWEVRVVKLDESRSAKASELGQLEQELRGMNGSGAAAEKAEAVEQELASVVSHGQDYLRLYLAERLLLENIETYRQQHQGPVLSRAQQVFTALTNGGFTQLVDDTGTDGKAVLRARRALEDGARANADAEPDGIDAGLGSAAPDGQLVGVEGMSEGTRDQLYLALRLATLERYAEEGRAMPLLLDDVLMTFDDERAAAALRVFDELSERFQVILLTHHAHLIEVAARALPEHRLHVHRVG